MQKVHDSRRHSEHVRLVFAASLVVILATILQPVPCSAQAPDAKPAEPKVLEEKFPFPPPVQWKMNVGLFGAMEISVVGLAWGPADSPQMISKASEVRGQSAPKVYPDRPYALGICLRAELPRPTQPQSIMLSGLVRIKDVHGSIEYPFVLTASGFAGLFVLPAGVSDIPLAGSDTAEHWDFFPVSPEEKEFLFQVIPPSQNSILSFRVRVKDNKLNIENVSPAQEPVQFIAHYAGTVGADTRLWFELSILGSDLSGHGFVPAVEAAKTLWFKGKIDSLGNFKLGEYHPEDQLIGTLDGKLSQDYRQVSGYYSRSDGMGLEPFQLQRTDPVEFAPPGVAPCPTQNTPAGWKTYINQKYRFCFSYPPIYTPVAKPEMEKDSPDLQCSSDYREAIEEGREAQLQDPRNPDAGLCVNVANEAWDLESLMKYEPTGQDSPPEPKIIQGQVFYYYGPGGGGVCYPDQFFYDLKGKPLYLAFTGPCVGDKTPSPETKQIEQKVLATFRTF